MQIKDIESTFNIGIPCYNHVFFKIHKMTSICYINGFGDKAISKERELRFEGINLIKKYSDLEFKQFDDTLFYKLSIGASTTDSKTKFGFCNTSKLCSMFDCKLTKPICLVNDDNVEILIDKMMKDNYNYRLTEFYRLKDILLKYDFSDLELDYFKYLDSKLVIKYILEQYCYQIIYLLNKKLIKQAQECLFVLSAYLKEYNDIKLNINKSQISLRTFVDDLLEKYPLKDEYLFRNGFINKTKEENSNIINSVINKTNIVLPVDLCQPGYSDIDHNSTNNKERKKTTPDDLDEIDRILNDRRMFYLSHEPIGEIRPSGPFAKYGAYIYPNGIIVADRFYDIKTIGSLKQDAIYKFDALNFEQRKNMSKSDLTIIPNSKIYHSKTWKERTSEYIKSQTTEEMKEKVKILIK